MSITMNRRQFMTAAGLGAGALAAMGLTGCGSPKSASTASAVDAKSQASGDSWLGEAPEIAAEKITATEDVDLLIVGAGNSGMPAAATAVDLGMSFMICEKSGSVQATRHFVGGVDTKWQRDAGVSVDKGKLLNELTRYASGKCDQSVWKVWINESAETLEWLDGIMSAAGHSIYFDNEGYDHAMGGTDYYVVPQQHMWYWPEVAEAVPPSLWGNASGEIGLHRNQVLADYVEAKGNPVRFGYEMVKLIREDSGRVTGAIFDTSNGYVQVNAAKGVLLCTGGYAANPSMVRALSPAVLESCTGGDYMPNCTGDGIKAALHIGARMDKESAPMIFDRGAVLPGESVGYANDDGSDKVAFPSVSSENVIGSLPVLKVNRRGQRFVNESCPYDWTANASAEQPGGVWCNIFDSSLPDVVAGLQVTGCAKIGAQLVQGVGIEGATATFPNGESFVKSGGLVSANTIEELAGKLGVPADNLVATVNRYNDLCDAGVDEDFGKEGFRLTPVRTAPFYGIWFGGTLLTTLDGVKINENMQVLDEDLEVILGLYAAGDTSGSTFSGNYPEYLVGCASGRTITEGRHAVRYISENE